MYFVGGGRVDKREYLRKYRETHKERLKQQSKEYRRTHKRQIKIRNKQYRETHKEYYKEYHKEYYKEHKEQIAEYNKQYYEKRKNHGICNNDCFNCIYNDCILPVRLARFNFEKIY